MGTTYLAKAFNDAGDSRIYKVYDALLTQTGTNIPISTVLENTLGSLTFSYLSPGTYRITSSSLFVVNKTFISFGDVINNANAQKLNITVKGEDLTSSKIDFQVFGDDVLGDNLLLKTPIYIRVYN